VHLDAVVVQPDQGPSYWQPVPAGGHADPKLTPELTRFPALSMGYDGQGYLYNRPGKLYNQRQRGLYFAGSQEVGLPGLQAHAGINISDFDSHSIFGSMAASYDVQDKVLLMAEWDNINNYVDSRINMGFRVYVTPSFNMDFAVRGIGQGGTFSNGVSRGAERIVQFKYTGNF